MKPNQNNRKLQLNKQAVSNLSKAEMQKLNAGEQPILLTSIVGCNSCLDCCIAALPTLNTSISITIITPGTLL